MNRLAVIAKRYSYAATAILLAAAMFAPVLILGNASAAQITERSVTPSSSSSGATGVTYDIQFTASAANASATIGGIVVDFCTGPIPGTTCTNPGVVVGTTVGAISGLSGTWTSSSSGSVLTLSNGTPEAPSGPISIQVSGFTNPTTTSNVTVYPRIFTYATNTHAAGYDDENPDAAGDHIDNGSAAFSVVPSIDVTAVVRETLTFCVSGDDLTGDTCSAASSPKVELGQDMDGVFVIDDTQVWTGDVYYQLTTNAANGTQVKIAGASANLQSSPTVNIPGLAVGGTIGSGDAGFGMRVVAAGAVAQPEDGEALTAEANFPTAADNYAMPSAVTDPYGLAFASNNGPVRAANGHVMFGARSAPNTPAGIYTASYSMIATPSY